MNNYIENIKQYVLTNHWIMTDNEYINKYVRICRFYKENPTKKTKYNFHHIFPSFLYKSELQEKNRYHTIEKLDNDFDPNQNTVKLPIQYHILSHFYLGLGLQTIDAINSFYVLIGDYSKNINLYTEDEVIKLAELIEENALETKQKEYLTISQIKEKNKQIREESKKQWKEENKDKVEEYKQKQKEYRKQQYQKQKEWLKSHKK